MTRERLPDDRQGMTQKFTITARRPRRQGEPDGTEEIDGYIKVNCYPDGRLGEIFLWIGKPGSTEAMYDQWAIAVSMALQHGATVDVLFGKHLGTRFEPSGAVQGVEGVRSCTSLLDLVARWVIGRYGEKKEELVETEPVVVTLPVGS
jgi:ribonucleoside-diphosphate reductase alpha chain